MTTIFQMISMILISLGVLFLTLGSYGIIKMPDFYRRMHAVSMSDTLGIILVTSGIIVQYGFSLISFKVFTIFLLIAITNPVGSHALARAALRSGMKPWNTNRNGSKTS